MAYSKQTWTDDVSAVTGARMTHIEQGIYDNSLATDKINPSGTATTTAEIEEGQITDVIGFKSLKLKGQTSQYTTTGKNKLNVTCANQTRNNVTLTNNGDGSVTLNGTASATTGGFSLLSSNTSWNVSDLPTGTINFSTVEALPSGVEVALAYGKENGDWLSNIAVLNNSSHSKSVTLTVPSDAVYVRANITVQNGTAVTNLTLHPQLETGSTQTSFEPYTGGIASPNPDFPQDVNNVSGDNVIQISNKNVLPNPIKSQTLNGVTVTRNSDGTLLINGTATANTYFDFSTDFDTTKYAGYKFYGFPNNPGFRIRISNSDRVSIQEIETNGTVIANNGTGKYIAIRIASGSNVNNRLLSPMLIAPTTTDTTYIAHQGNEFELNFTKNLFDSEKYLENAGISYNTITSSNNNNLFYIPVQYGRNYTMSFIDNGVSGNILYGFSNDKPVIGGACTYNVLDITQLNKHTFTPVSANNKYLCIRLNVVNTNQYLAMENIQVEVGNQATEYIAYNENPIEICKIGTYQDYIYKKDGKWYKYKIIQKTIFDGTEEWRKSGNTSVDRFWLKLYNGSVPSFHNMFSNKFNYQYNVSSLNVAWIDVYEAEERLFVNYTAYGTTTLEQFQEWLATAKPIFYYPLAKPIEEEITYTPLIRQLDELYNSGLYDNTNISQDNSSEAFILDLEACKNNINGIVEYIRR